MQALEKKTASIPTPSFTATSYLSADDFTLLWIEFGTFKNIRLEHSLQEGMQNSGLFLRLGKY